MIKNIWLICLVHDHIKFECFDLLTCIYVWLYFEQPETKAGQNVTELDLQAQMLNADAVLSPFLQDV